MKYDQADKQAVSGLSVNAKAVFGVLASYEQGDFVALPELCRALNQGGQFIAFSCLSGSGSDQKLGLDMGGLFLGRIRKVVTNLILELKSLGYQNGLKVILDDCEPRRVWQWSIPQEEVSLWYQMVIEDSRDQIPDGWQVVLWSEIERPTGVCYEQILEGLNDQNNDLLIHQQLEYMKKFPNKKLLGNIREAVLRRIGEYSLQGQVLEKVHPEAVLVQTETPWRVKDPLFSPLRQRALPIIHPYPEERR